MHGNNVATANKRKILSDAPTASIALPRTRSRYPNRIRGNFERGFASIYSSQSQRFTEQIFRTKTRPRGQIPLPSCENGDRQRENGRGNRKRGLEVSLGLYGMQTKKLTSRGQLCLICSQTDSHQLVHATNSFSQKFVFTEQHA